VVVVAKLDLGQIKGHIANAIQSYAQHKQQYDEARVSELKNKIAYLKQQREQAKMERDIREYKAYKPGPADSIFRQDHPLIERPKVKPWWLE
jgi:succinylglutamate desuccinylase